MRSWRPGTGELPFQGPSAPGAYLSLGRQLKPSLNRLLPLLPDPLARQVLLEKREACLLAPSHLAAVKCAAAAAAAGRGQALCKGQPTARHLAASAGDTSSLPFGAHTPVVQESRGFPARRKGLPESQGTGPDRSREEGEGQPSEAGRGSSCFPVGG